MAFKIPSFFKILKNPQTLAMSLSVAAAFIMLIGKLAAYALTKSTAIFSDAAESVVHLFATAIAASSLWYSRQPADEDHPYGHGKIAYFSAAGEAIVIFFASLSILFFATEALVNARELNDLDTGIIILVFLGLVNLALGAFLVHVGKRYNSLVLLANGKHVLTDMWTSLGVVAGVGVVYLTGCKWLDPIIAILVGLNIMWTACRLLFKSYEGLMEKADKKDDTRLKQVLNQAVEKEWIVSYHQLRHRKVNDRLWVEFHAEFKGDISLKQAHEQTCLVEMSIKKAFPKDKLYITSHLEPEEHLECHPQGHPEFENVH